MKRLGEWRAIVPGEMRVRKNYFAAPRLGVIPGRNGQGVACIALNCCDS